LRRIILACVCLLACSTGGASRAIAAGKTSKTTEAKRAAAIAWLGDQIYGYQRLTWRWEP